MSARETGKYISARDRLLDAAYALFAAEGIARVGIDRILDRSGCARGSLYYNFQSKDELALAFLDRHEAVWTRAWLEDGIRDRADTPEGRLLAIFDLFDEWFRRDGFEGCAFINVMLESEPGSEIRASATEHLARIRDVVRDIADEGGLDRPDDFAQAWHILMKGSVVSAGEGNRNAARTARRAAALVLQGWPRRR